MKSEQKRLYEHFKKIGRVAEAKAILEKYPEFAEVEEVSEVEEEPKSKKIKKSK